MKYPLNEKYSSPELMAKIMGPNPMKLEEELLTGHLIPAGSVVCDLGSGQGLTSVFLAKEYGFTVYAADLWSDPEENRRFFREMGLSDAEIIPVKADATDLPFEQEFFDAVFSTDSYNYFGRDPNYLDEKLLPFVKKGGYVYIAIPGMKQDCHDHLPPELLLSWTPEQLDYMHDAAYCLKGLATTIVIANPFLFHQVIILPGILFGLDKPFVKTDIYLFHFPQKTPDAYVHPVS